MSKRGKTAGIALKKDDESSELVIKSEADDDRLNDVRGFNGCFVSETWLDATLPSGMALGGSEIQDYAHTYTYSLRNSIPLKGTLFTTHT